jgi:phosphatidylglycerol:prolipoprotein diacylglycerol transferase
MLIIPNIDPIAFEFLSIKIYWYGLSYFFGVIIGFFIIKKLDQKYLYLSGDSKLLDNFIFYLIVGILLGGRIGYILFYNLLFYLQNPLEIFKVWHGGMAFHGAFFGLILSIYIFAKKYKVKYFGLTDYLCFTVPIGIFFGRISNFINQELIGRETNFIYGVKFANDDKVRHASQLYEALSEGFLIFLIFLFLEYKFKILKNPGKITSFFLILYGVSRFIVEFFREPDVQIGLFMDYFTLGQIFCIIMIIISFFVLFKMRKLN